METDDDLAGLEVFCPSCSGAMSIPQAYKYWAFISYSHQDNIAARSDGRRGCIQWAEWLHREIETYQIPALFRNRKLGTGELMPARFFPVFQDEKELPLSGDLGQSIRTALRQSRFLIVVCSPRSAVSRYVNEEVRFFKQMGRGKRILAMIIDGEPNASLGNKPGILPEDECFCPALRHPLSCDGFEDFNSLEAQEPIAGDARIKSRGAAQEALLPDLRGDHRHALRTVKLKLLAGLMGVGLDELVLRDQERTRSEAGRKRRRFLIVSAWVLTLAALALTASTIAVRQKIEVFMSKGEVEVQKAISLEKTKEADVEKQKALCRRYSAEFTQIQTAWEDGNMERIRIGLDATRPAKGELDLRGWEWHYLNSVFQKPQKSFQSGIRGGPPVTIMWSPSGDRLATGGGATYDQLASRSTMPIQVRNADTGKLELHLADKGFFPRWNARGNLLAAIVNNQACVWEMSSGKLLARHAGHGNALGCLAWRGDQDQIAFGGFKRIESTKEFHGELLIKSAVGGDSIFDLAWKDKGIRDIDWDPDGKVLAIGWIFPSEIKQKPGVGLLDVAAGKGESLLVNKASRGNGANRMAWQANGAILALDCGGWVNHPVELFDTGTKKEIRELDNGGIEMDWSPDGSRLLGLAEKGNRSLIKSWEPGRQSHSSLLWLAAAPLSGNFGWSPDGTRLATFFRPPDADDWQIDIWSVNQLWKDHETWFLHPGKRSTSIAWSRDGKLLASAGNNGEIVVADTTSGTCLKRKSVHDGAITGLEWSHTGEELLVVGSHGRAGIVVQLSGEMRIDWLADAGLSEITCAAWGPGSLQIAMGTKAGRIIVWDRQSRAVGKDWAAHQVPIKVISWLPNGTLIASADQDGNLATSTWPQGARQKSVDTGHGDVLSIACDQTGHQIATSGMDRRVRLWETATLNDGPVLVNHETPVVAVTFNPVDGRLASFDESGVIWIWDPIQGHGLLRIQDTVFSPTKDHRKDFFKGADAAWSPDGLRLAAAGEDASWRGGDGITHVWNARHPEEKQSR